MFVRMKEKQNYTLMKSLLSILCSTIFWILYPGGHDNKFKSSNTEFSGGTKEAILLNLQYHNILCSVLGICYNAIRENLAPEPCLLALCIVLSINN